MATKQKQQEIEFRLGIESEAKRRHYPQDGVNRAIGYFIGEKTIGLEHEAACLRLAEQWNSSNPGQKGSAMLTPSILIESEGIASRVEVDIEELRLELFGSKNRPFKTIEKAAEWIESARMPKHVGADEADRLYIQAVKLLDKAADIRQLNVTTSGWVPYTVPYLKSENDGAPHWQRRMVPRNSKQAILAHRCKQLGESTGFSELAIVNFVLLGTRPLLPPIQITFHEQTVTGRFARSWATVIFNSRDVTMRQFRQLYNSLRRELNLVRSKPLKDEDAKFLELVQKLGGAPESRSGQMDFWKDFLTEWNKNYPGHYTGGWKCPYLRHRRLRARMRV